MEICFLQIFWKDGLSKKIALEYDLFCNIWKDGISFFPKINFFFTRTMKDDLSQKKRKKIMEIWYFLYICINVINRILPFCQKRKDNLLPQKIHLKVTFPASLKKMIFIQENMVLWYFCWNTILINILDWHSRKTSNDSLYFYGDLYRRFYILLSSEKNSGNLTYRIEIWLLLQFKGLKILCNEKPSILCTIQPSGVVFRGVLKRQLRKF